METIKIKNSRGQNLVADLYKADTNKIIIMCHGFNYDRHDKDNKIDKLANAFYEAGYSVLPFDFGGSGESDDGPLTVANQVEDLRSVINFVRDNGYSDVILFGGSLGGLTAFEAYDKDIRAIIGLAPSTVKAEPDWRTKHFSAEQLEELAKAGQMYIPAKGFTKVNGLRDKILIDKQYLRERENLDQEAILKDIKCPVLIFHSDNDEFVPLEASKNAIKIMGNNAKLYFIKGAGHSFVNHVDMVAEKTLDWLKEIN